MQKEFWEEGKNNNNHKLSPLRSTSLNTHEAMEGHRQTPACTLCVPPGQGHEARARRGRKRAHARPSVTAVSKRKVGFWICCVLFVMFFFSCNKIYCFYKGKLIFPFPLKRWRKIVYKRIFPTFSSLRWGKFFVFRFTAVWTKRNLFWT